MKPVISSQNEIFESHIVHLELQNHPEMKATWCGENSFDGVRVSHTEINDRDHFSNIDRAAKMFVDWLNKRLHGDGVKTRTLKVIKSIAVSYHYHDEYFLTVEVQDQAEGFVIVFNTLCTGWQSAVDEFENPIVYATEAEATAELVDAMKTRNQTLTDQWEIPDETLGVKVMPIREFVPTYKTIWYPPAASADLGEGKS